MADVGVLSLILVTADLSSALHHPVHPALLATRPITSSHLT